MKTSWKFLVSFFFVVGFSACHSCFEDENFCPPHIVCTEVFVSVSIPFELNQRDFKTIDFSRTFKVDTNEKIYEHSYNQPFDLGPYHAVILTDAQRNEIEKSGSKLKFELLDTSGVVVYQADFVLGHDCCHILKLMGPDKIIL